MTARFPSGATLAEVRSAVVGVDVVVASALPNKPPSGNLAGAYRITNLTRRSLVVAPHSTSGINIERRVSVEIETGRSREHNGVVHHLHPTNLAALRALTGIGGGS